MELSQRFLTASEAIDWIHGERWKGEKNGLINTRALLEALNHPEERMGRVIHVAGTNGKGSTCAMIERALRECGYTTGLFTSPYLCRFHERIRLCGVPISDDDLIETASLVREAAQALAAEGREAHFRKIHTPSSLSPLFLCGVYRESSQFFRRRKRKFEANEKVAKNSKKHLTNANGWSTIYLMKEIPIGGGNSVWTTLP